MVYETKKVQRMHNQRFLMNLQFFKNWNGVPIDKFIKYFEILEARPNQVIYNAKESANVFFIVRSGLLYMEHVVEVEDLIRIPVSARTWKHK